MEQRDELQKKIDELEERIRKISKIAKWFYAQSDPKTDWAKKQIDVNYKRFINLCPPADKRAYHHRSAMIFERLDNMTTDKLIKIRKTIGKNYEDLFDGEGQLKDGRSTKLERLYTTIDIRIVENLKLWR